MLELREGQKAELQVEVTTASGNAAAIQAGSARFTSSDESVVSVVQDPANELRATIHGLDGTANDAVVVEFRADGDQDADEVREIVGSVSVICTRGDAVVAAITAGPVVDDVPVVEPGPEPGPISGGDVDGSTAPADE